MHLTDLSDAQVVSNLKAICAEDRRVLADLLAHLVEVEDRRLHLLDACSSLFDFCVRRLQMSEGEAFRRITAARLVRRFPGLLERIRRGDIHLTAVALLRDHLTESNWEELVNLASHQSKRAVKELLAKRFPKPDVPATLRKLPSPAHVATAPHDPSVLAAVAPHDHAAPTSPASPALQLANPPGSVTQSPCLEAPFEPLSEARYKLQLTASAELRKKLERATDLMRHRNPKGDLAVVVEHALDVLIAKLEKERLGKTDRPAPGGSPRAKHDRAPSAKPGYIPRAARREVFARDGEQCTFVNEAGERCPAHAFLELDHLHPRALGGSGDASNVSVLCRAHNRLRAEQVFGRETVERQIHLRQHTSRQAPEAEPNGPDGAPTPFDRAAQGLVHLGFRHRSPPCARRSHASPRTGGIAHDGVPASFRAGEVDVISRGFLMSSFAVSSRVLTHRVHSACAGVLPTTLAKAFSPVGSSAKPSRSSP